METLEEKIARVLRDKVALVPYDPIWPERFEDEKVHLLACLPDGMITRIEHYGSTSIPGMTAKPIVDMLVEVPDIEATRRVVAPILEEQAYDFFWRPLGENDGPPHYPWFIKRDGSGNRTHHIHMVEADSSLWEGLIFRDYLRDNPDQAAAYLRLKQSLAEKFPDDRIAYTVGKTDFIRKTLVLSEQTSNDNH